MLTITVLGTTTALQPIGTPCTKNTECITGSCRGANCAGRCYPMISRAALLPCSPSSMTPWCGCDGKTVLDCRAPDIYAHQGTCKGTSPPIPPIPVPITGNKAIGMSCNTGSECITGYCRGSNCQGKCVPMVIDTKESYTMAFTEWCGCDGKTFRASSGQEPWRVYAHKGACEEEAEEDTGTPAPVVVAPATTPGKWKALLVIGLVFVTAAATAGAVYYRKAKK